MPSLNTQSCIRRLQIYVFRAVWAAPSDWKRKFGPIVSNYRGLFFFMFRGQIFFKFFFENITASVLKSCIIFLLYFFFFNFFLPQKRLILKFSNLSVLQKGLLMQDWVFRLETLPNFGLRWENGFWWKFIEFFLKKYFINLQCMKVTHLVQIIQFESKLFYFASYGVILQHECT